VATADWTDLKLQCNGRSTLGHGDGEQVVLETRQQWEDFLRWDCLRDEDRIIAPAVDFGERLVIVDAVLSPLPDGTCVGDRRVAQVDACVGGVQVLYDDTDDPTCGQRLLVGSISISRREARAAFLTSQDRPEGLP
jgi:hypothetical protein